MGIAKACREAAATLVRLWCSARPSALPRKTKAQLFRDFTARYRERRKHRRKPSTLETFDIYLCNRVMPQFGRIRLDPIDHARARLGFDAVSADRPGAANRAFEIIHAMLAASRDWGELWAQVPDSPAPTSPRTPAGPLHASSTARNGNASARCSTIMRTNTIGP